MKLTDPARLGVSVVWGERWGLNPRPSEPQPDALPAELRSPCINMRTSIRLLW